MLYVLLIFIPLALSIQTPPVGVLRKMYPDDSIYTQGDVCCNYMIDEEDDLVVQESGQFHKVTAHMDGRLLHSTDHNMTKEAILSEYCQHKRESCPQKQESAFTINSVPTTGSLRNIIVLMRFSDHVARPLPSKSDYETIANSMTINPSLTPTGSLRKYYLDQSYNKMNITSVVTDWIDVPYTESFAADDCSALCRNSGGIDSNLHIAIRNALQQADSTINYSEFDADSNGYIDLLTIIHSGYGAEFGGTDSYGQYYEQRIWSHKWAFGQSITLDSTTMYLYNVNAGQYGRSGTTPTRIGLLAHEMGHVFGLPDLYDTTDPRSLGASYYTLMANSYGIDGTMTKCGSIDPWCKSQLGWVKIETLSASGLYEIEPYQVNGHVLMITNNYPVNEYILIESRSNNAGISAYDSDMPAGMYVWHIDEYTASNSETSYPGQSGWPAQHFKVRVIQKDNLFELERGIYSSNLRNDVYYQISDELGDTTEPSLTSYEQLESVGCMTTGNHLSGFVYSATSNGSVTYTKTSPVSCFPTLQPTPLPSPLPTTALPSVSPTRSPTTALPSVSPTEEPTPEPTTALPTVSPTNEPTPEPTTALPSVSPTNEPTPEPTTALPSVSPTMSPTGSPTRMPLNCGAGYYVNQTSWTCAMCPVGTFSQLQNSSTCDVCDPGSFSASSGASTCSTCLVGYYQPYLSSTSCTQCDTGRSTANNGSAICDLQI